jgi:uncharacterized membrane protein
MVDEIAAVSAVLLLMLVTMATRVAGVWIMAYVEITPRVEAFLKYMAASVLISIVAPTTLSASPRIWLAVGAAVVLAIVTGSALVAMTIAIVSAAVARSLGF